MRNIREWGNRWWMQGVLGALSVLFFVMYSFLYQGLPKTEILVFNQPDEMANYAFIKEWVVHGEVGIVEPLAGASLNQVHPRSMTVVGGRLVPIAFPGFIVVMSSLMRPVVWLFGEQSFNSVVVRVTPLLAVFSAWVMFGIIRALGLEKRTAFIGAMALLFLPPWWYGASRPLQATVMFVFFVLSGLWLGLLKNNKLARFFFNRCEFWISVICSAQ